jgi:hypothetical protein
LIAALVVVGVAIPVAVTLLKGQWLFFSAGFMTVGVAWWLAPFRLAQPTSWWARHLYGPQKLERARDRYGPNGTFGARKRS